MVTPLVAGNWKMNTTVAEAAALARDMRSPLSEIAGVTRVVCPPFVSLGAVADALAGSPVLVGAQNMHPEPKGAFTGEISGTMLQGICSHVIVGHSERRRGLGENDAFVNAKLIAALALGLIPILCVGESLEERDAGRAVAVVGGQLAGSLAGVSPGDIARVVVAYEPVWAIGTGRAATPETAQEMAAAVRSVIDRLSGGSAGAVVPVLYGGSVNAENAAEIAAQPDIDGALVGGASLQVEGFVAIARAFASGG